jgi:hypothetical protein
MISKSTKYDANSADKTASAGTIPEHSGRDPGVRRIISEYSGENTISPLGDHMRKSSNGQDSADITDTVVKPAGFTIP